MKLIDKLVVDGSLQLLMENARSINFTILMNYLVSVDWHISEQQMEEVEVEKLSADRATKFMRLIKSNQTGSVITY